MFLSEIKKQTSYFLRDKYKTARLALTDVTQAELLIEEATNSDPWGPDAKTMTRISEAAFDIDDYWRIVDVLHRRLRSMNWKEWRQLYKTLIVLEFFLTHGPESFSEEFCRDMNDIRELGNFNYVDEKGFNWGSCMQLKAERILKLLGDKEQLKEARSKAQKVSQEIQGFGNLIVSSSSSSSQISRTSSFGSYSLDSPTWSAQDEPLKNQEQCNKSTNELFDDLKQGPAKKFANDTMLKEEVEGLHLWDTPIAENANLLESSDEEEDENSNGWSARTYSPVSTTNNRIKRDNRAVALRSLSNTGKTTKKFERQSSWGF
ncbi:ENTH domain-containing protein C794.11c-like [Typha latifolia]|uniref:ENTH domain-containing protein C794.11c-like n=1 Tax=Typha latifolia TaxID=4733 RepID=UPI003C2DC118